MLNIVVLSIAINTANAADIFTDSFETGDFSATNVQGFSWADNVRMGVVTEAYETTTNSKKVNIAKKDASEFPGGDWIPYSGQHSMRFAYPAGEAWSEKRFDLGTPMKDIWIRFWLRIPMNFSYGPTGNPNKLFSLWCDGYSAKGDGSTVWLGFHRYNTTDATVSITYSDGNYTSSNAYQQSKLFTTSNDGGRWMHLVMHFKTESKSGERDGVIQTYRRWAGESSYTKLHEKLGLPIKVPTNGSPNGFKSGYLLGWANAAYQQNTEWLLDDFIISDSSPMGQLTKLPKAPTNLVVNE